ncbi:MAG: chemotaxis protein CheW [Burkholderiales bacterium]|jgi:twitching motility protein PilI|nr:chemotaxis protein CheW [Burkholderiales bacterium]
MTPEVASTAEKPLTKPKRTSLRSFQNELAVRIATRSVSVGEEEFSQLGVFVGGRHLLLDLRLIDEVLYPQAVTPILLAHSWFLGLTNVRGDIYNVIDLADFLGAPASPNDSNTRWILFGRSGIAGGGALNVAFVVQQVFGLRSTKGFSAADPREGDLPWFEAEWTDPSGNVWSHLNLMELAKDPIFQQIERK